ncbi:MAG: NAD-dependent protein deacetylase [Woeseiaceae bacterium]
MDTLQRFLESTPSLTVLTGAGVSTGSGIPDYRDSDGNSKVKTPIQFPEFVGSERSRQRYWARSFVGWQRFSKAAPNRAHRALVNMEADGRIDTLITQNVDGLHREAGSQNLIDLHGDLAVVVCLQCDHRLARSDYQQQLQEANEHWHTTVFAIKPDGDAELAETNLAAFKVPRCDDCGGVLKPDVVLFGENVPRDRVAEASASVERSDGLLILGSSLMVFSGFRFARQAHALGKPIAIVNQGKTRADDLATVKVTGDCAEALSKAL